MSPAVKAAQALECALARAAFYRFLAAAFLYPAPRGLAALREVIPAPLAPHLWGGRAPAVLGPPLEEVRRLLAETTDAGLESAYRTAFGHTVSEEYPPLEARYISRDTFQESQTLADVAAFYNAFGLRARRGVGERDDHVAVELEFAHLLALKEAYARERDDATGAERSLTASRGFLADHLGRWGPVFADRLAHRAPTPLTRALATLLAAVLRTDAETLGVTPRPVNPEPIPVPPEPSPEDAPDGDLQVPPQAFSTGFPTAPGTSGPDVSGTCG